MKIIVNISDSLFKRAKRLAKIQQATFEEITEAALQAYVYLRERSHQPFKLKKASVRGKRISKEISSTPWCNTMEYIYEGRGSKSSSHLKPRVPAKDPLRTHPYLSRVTFIENPMLPLNREEPSTCLVCHDQKTREALKQINAGEGLSAENIFPYLDTWGTD